MCNIFWQKKKFFKVFSETAYELMVTRRQSNAHHAPHLMQKVPAYLLNLPRRKSRLLVETSMLGCNILTVKEMI